MRPTPPPAIAVLVVVAAQYSDESLKQLSHPPSSSASTCDSNSTCTRPSSGGGEERLEANAATILIILLCALICAVALNIAIRCSLRYNSRQLETQAQQHQHMRKPDMQDVEVQPPTLIFSVGMKLAGEEAECAICLSEFVEGEGIRVLDKCRHGFHIHCIQKWLSSHSSCPTCRASCLPSLSVSDEESGTTSNRNSAPGGGVPDSF